MSDNNDLWQLFNHVFALKVEPPQKPKKDKSIKKLDWCGSNYGGNLGCCFNNETKIQHLKFKRSKCSFERSLAHLPILE